MFVPEATHAFVTYVYLYYVPLMPCYVWIECNKVYIYIDIQKVGSFEQANGIKKICSALNNNLNSNSAFE